MGTWVGKFEEDKTALERRLAVLEKLRPVVEVLDQAEIPAIGFVTSESVYIKGVGEELVPKLVRLKTAPVTKHFSAFSGDLFYATAINDITVYIFPDTTKFVCKIKKTETTKQEERSEVVFELEADCDPLMMEEVKAE